MSRLLTALQRIQSRTETVRAVDTAAAKMNLPLGHTIEEPLWSDQAEAEWQDNAEPDALSELEQEWPSFPVFQWPQDEALTLPQDTESLLEAAEAALAEELSAEEMALSDPGVEVESELELIADVPQAPEVSLDIQSEAPAEIEPPAEVVAETPLEADHDTTNADSPPPIVAEIEPETEVNPALPLACATSPAQPGDSVEEPIVSLRMPGFGRPQEPEQTEEQSSEAVTRPRNVRRPPSVPFLPPSHRPYRAACESILAALPEDRSIALILGWIDEDLDHSALTARLAEVMANRLDDPVLLIDVGASRRLTSLLRIPCDGNLSDALTGLVSWRDQIIQTDTAGLCLLPSAPGDFAADPVAVARLIEACKEDFALVVIVGAAVSAYPENLLSAADAAVVLLEAGHTPVPDAAQSVERLRRNGLEMLGCLMTGNLEGK